MIQGGSLTSDIRTSKGTWFGRKANPVISKIEERIANWSQLPAEFGEPLQILNYQVSCFNFVTSATFTRQCNSLEHGRRLLLAFISSLVLSVNFNDSLIISSATHEVIAFFPFEQLLSRICDFSTLSFFLQCDSKRQFCSESYSIILSQTLLYINLDT